MDGDISPLPVAPQTLKFRLCKSCLDSLVVAYEKAREELWDRLPSFFGLSPWEELKDFDAYSLSHTIPHIRSPAHSPGFADVPFL